MRQNSILITNQQGQTIAELLTACFIILVGLAAILTASISILNTISVSKDILIATNLAREGLEVLRNKRDNNWLAGVNFDDGLNFDQASDGIDEGDRKSKSRILVSKNVISLNSAVQIAGQNQIDNCGANCLLKIDAGLYNHTTGNNTKFSRLITLTSVCNDAGGASFPVIDLGCSNGGSSKPKISIQAVAQTGWQQKGNWRVVTLREYLYDWKLP